MKDPCAKYKKRAGWTRYYAPRVKAIEKNLDAEGKKIWEKLNTCSRIKLVDKFSKAGQYKYAGAE